MRTSERGVRLIENFEGYRSYRYLDSVGVPTIGYGTTSADVSPLPARCTQAQAEGWLRQNLNRKYEPSVNALRNWQPQDQNRFDALVSLAYNCGPGSMTWQIGRDVRAGDWRAASNDFMHYVYAGGQVLQGLVNRRGMERALFLEPIHLPSPYAMFPNKALIHGINERRTVIAVDRALKHPRRNRHYLRVTLRPRLKLLRDRCKRLARMYHPTAWNDSRKFGARWQALNNRMKEIDRATR